MNLQPTSLLQLQYFGNALSTYLLAFIAFVISLAIFKLLQSITLNHLEKLAQKTQNQLDDTLIQVVHSIKPPFYSYLSFFLAINLLKLNHQAQKLFTAILIIWGVYQVIQATQILINFIAKRYLARNETKSAQSATQAIKLVTNIFLWSTGTLLILSNLGFDVTSLIASLGIGGIAVAMASKDILSGIFSSFVIYFEKPFHIGETIKIGEYKGKVTKIGLRSTTLTPIQGGVIVIPNEKVTSTPIENLKKKAKRRVAINLGVTYQTKPALLESIPNLIKTTVNSHKLANFDRAYLTTFADSSLIFEVVYHIKAPDFTSFLKVQHQVNLKILQTLEKNQVNLAYPTQTIHLQK